MVFGKVSHKIKEVFDSPPVYKKKILKIKLISDANEITDFREEEIPKADSFYTYLAVIIIDIFPKKDENYNSQVFLKECKYIEKK